MAQTKYVIVPPLPMNPYERPDNVRIVTDFRFAGSHITILSCKQMAGSIDESGRCLGIAWNAPGHRAFLAK